MSLTGSVWLVIVAALIAANLPFINQRLMVVLPLRTAVKGLAWRLLELVLWYAFVIGVGMAMERAQGQNQPQRWEFYAVTAAMFLTLAFPGFVYRYLVRRGR